jgi:hypothetical protein
MPGFDTGLFWLPTIAVAVIGLFALLGVRVQLPSPTRNAWLVILLVLLVVATGISAWEQSARRATASRLDQVWARLGDVKGLPPLPPGTSPDKTVEAVASAIEALNARIAELETQITGLQQKAQTRSIPADNAAKLVEFLHDAGSHRVVISCVPDDIEAYAYANQFASLLRQAGWDALGPETTTIFGEAPGMGIVLYVRGTNAPPDAAKLLLDAFTKFNIPYQSGIMPSAAIPDAATVELFVGHKP